MTGLQSIIKSNSVSVWVMCPEIQNQPSESDLFKGKPSSLIRQCELKEKRLVSSSKCFLYCFSCTYKHSQKSSISFTFGKSMNIINYKYKLYKLYISSVRFKTAQIASSLGNDHRQKPPVSNPTYTQNNTELKKITRILK